MFYKRDQVPVAGDEFNGKVATEVYTGFETEEDTSNVATGGSTTPWDSKWQTIKV